MNEMTVHIWAEHTALFGRTVAVQNLDQYDGDPADCGDWVQYTGTAAEFDAQARDLDTHTPDNHASTYRSRTAAVLRDFACDWAYIHRHCLEPGCDGREHVCRECGRCGVHCACDAETDQEE